MANSSYGIISGMYLSYIRNIVLIKKSRLFIIIINGLTSGLIDNQSFQSFSLSIPIANVNQESRYNYNNAYPNEN